jgi:VanZ family protein
MKRFLAYWLPPVAWMATIFVLSAQPDLPQPAGPWLENVTDKAAHAVTYGILAWLVLRAVRQHRPVSVKLLAACAALATAYGVTDEFHQMFVPGRNASLADLAADALGAGVAMVLAAWLERRRVRARRLSAAQR